MSTSKKQFVLAVRYGKHQQTVCQGLSDLLVSYKGQIFQWLWCSLGRAILKRCYFAYGTLIVFAYYSHLIGAAVTNRFMIAFSHSNKIALFSTEYTLDSHSWKYYNSRPIKVI